MSFKLKSAGERRVYVPGESIVEESHAREADIHYIIDQFTRTGVLLHNKEYEGTYGDYPTGDQYEEMQVALAEASTMFETLPQEVRANFPRGTGQFLEFIHDPENADSMNDMGLDTSHFPPIEKSSKETKPAGKPAEPKAQINQNNQTKTAENEQSE